VQKNNYPLFVRLFPPGVPESAATALRSRDRICLATKIRNPNHPVGKNTTHVDRKNTSIAQVPARSGPRASI